MSVRAMGSVDWFRQDGDHVEEQLSVFPPFQIIVCQSNTTLQQIAIINDVTHHKGSRERNERTDKEPSEV